MKKPCIPVDEQHRLHALHSLSVLDTPPEERFDRITRLALRLFNVPISLISFIDAERQWIKSSQGTFMKEISRDTSLCGHTILGNGPLVIEDTLLDSRFVDNPLVTEESHFRFYAGQPLYGPKGYKIGTLCIIDQNPRHLSPEKLKDLSDLVKFAEAELHTFQLNSFIECLPDGAILYDHEGVIHLLNSKAENIFDRKTAEVSGHTVDFLIPHCLSEEKKEFNRNHCVLSTESRELKAIRKDGRAIPVEFAASRIKYNDTTKLIGIIHDLTARKYAEEQLTLQAAALGSAANGILITDTRGIIQWVNPAFSDLTGYSAQEIIGQNTRVLKSGKQDQTYYKKLWETITSGRVWHGELINRRKDGTHCIEEMTITPVRNAVGEITHFVSIKQNITARKTAEEKLRKTLAELKTQNRKAERARSEARGIFDATSEAMIMIASDDRILAVNHQFERFFSITEKNIAGLHIGKISQSIDKIFDDPEKFKSFFHTTPNKNYTVKDTINQQWPQQRILEFFSAHVQNSDCEYLGRLFIFRDITHEREIDRMKSEFVSLVSHELRTPLTSIIGYVDLILDGDAGDINIEQKGYLETVRKNACHLTALVKDLLDVSRIEAGSIKLNPSKLNLAALIQETGETLRPIFDSKHQQFHIDIPDELPSIEGDADRITQIFVNLLSNANKYTPSGGSILVTAQHKVDHILVDIQDTGIGMTQGELSMLFTKFFRAKNLATQEVGGTGLGLWITRSLVEMHGGDIKVSSSPGKGTTISFELPIIQVFRLKVEG